MANDSSKGPAKPFEWLSGGLFFGRNKDGIESVDSCKDPVTLLNGIQDNLNNILAANSNQQPSDANDSKATEATKSEPSDADFLEARLARLQFLLYDERRTTTSADLNRWSSNSGNPNIATGAVQVLVTSSIPTPEQPYVLVSKLVHHLPILRFESRKHVASILNYLLVCGLDGSDATLYVPIMTAFVQHVDANFENVVSSLMRGYRESSSNASACDVALHCGSIFRSCLKHVALYRQLVFTTQRVEQFVYPFLDTLVHVPNFDISSDAMESLRHIFTAGAGGDAQQSNAGNGGGAGGGAGNTPSAVTDEETQRELATLSADFLTRDYEAIWEQRFNPKLMSDQANYMTKRIALQILSAVLLTRSNYSIMIKYVNSRQNLILIMKLLRDTSPHITLDAFHVFKVFVANPTKIPEVVKILKDNQDKLSRYLETLHPEREASDTQFRDEKALIIATIRGL